MESLRFREQTFIEEGAADSLAIVFAHAIAAHCGVP